MPSRRGTPARMRELARRRRQVIDGLADQAFDLIGVDEPAAALREEVTATLTAALADPDVAEQILAGALVRPVRWEGFGSVPLSRISALPRAHRTGRDPKPAVEADAGTPDRREFGPRLDEGRQRGSTRTHGAGSRRSSARAELGAARKVAEVRRRRADQGRGRVDPLEQHDPRPGGRVGRRPSRPRRGPPGPAARADDSTGKHERSTWRSWSNQAMKFATTLELHGKTATGIEVPDEVVEALGGRQPTGGDGQINDYTYRSTIARMGGRVPAARRPPKFGPGQGSRPVSGSTSMCELDAAPREVVVPDDFRAALDAAPGAAATFDKLSFTHRKEHVRAIEDAKTEATRQRRIAKAIEKLTAG